MSRSRQREEHSSAIAKMATARRPPKVDPPAPVKKAGREPHPREGELMPCPRCGGKGIFEYMPYDWGYTTPSIRAVCAGCPMVTPARDIEAWAPARGHFSVAEVAIGEVIAWWNKRSEPRPAPGPSVPDGMKRIERKAQAVVPVGESCSSCRQLSTATQHISAADARSMAMGSSDTSITTHSCRFFDVALNIEHGVGVKKCAPCLEASRVA